MRSCASTAAVFQSIASLQQPPADRSTGRPTRRRPRATAFSLGALIQFRLAETYAAANGITVADADVQKTLDGLPEERRRRRACRRSSPRTAPPLDDVRELVRLSLVQEAVAKAVTANQLGEEELQKRYQQQIANYTTLQVDHILVDSQAKAEDVYRQVTAPGFTLADFQALAKKVSIDPNAQQNGGELTLAAGQLVAEFADAALAMQPGEISKPVQTQYGWHVIWMIDQQVTPFDQARDQILQSCPDRRSSATGCARRDADGQIEVNPSFGRFDDQQLAGRPDHQHRPAARPRRRPSAPSTECRASP